MVDERPSAAELRAQAHHARELARALSPSDETACRLRQLADDLEAEADALERKAPPSPRATWCYTLAVAISACVEPACAVPDLNPTGGQARMLAAGAVSGLDGSLKVEDVQVTAENDVILVVEAVKSEFGHWAQLFPSRGLAWALF